MVEGWIGLEKEKLRKVERKKIDKKRDIVEKKVKDNEVLGMVFRVVKKELKVEIVLIRSG